MKRLYNLIGVFALSVMTLNSVGCSSKEKYDYKRRAECVSKLYKIASGEDRVLDAKEKRRFLDELGFTDPIDETGHLRISTYQGSKTDEIHIQFHNGKYPINVGNISVKEAEEFIARHSK